MVGFFSASVVLVAVGVVLIWGINGSVRGIEVNTIGGILVLAGLIGALLSLVRSARKEGSSIGSMDDEPRILRR
jgi:hypothetical protein